MKCPHCEKEINIGSLLGSIKSDRKAKAARLNGAQKKILKAGMERCESAAKRVESITNVIEKMEEAHSKEVVKIWKSWEDQIPRGVCQHISGCSNPGFQTKGRTVYLCKEHS